MFLYLVALALVLVSSGEQDPLSLDDACRGAGDSCGLHALQVGLSSVRVVSASAANLTESTRIYTKAVANATADANPTQDWKTEGIVVPALLRWRQRLENSPSLRFLFESHSGQPTHQALMQQADEHRSNSTSQASRPLDQIRRDFMNEYMVDDPIFQQVMAGKRRNYYVGFIIASVLPFLIIMIENPKNKNKPSEVKKQISLKVTKKELSEHNTASSLWISIGGVVCDVTDFLMLHPGGPDVLLQHAGTEASEHFEEIGHSEFARQMVHERAVGLLLDAAVAANTGTHGTTILSRLFTKEDSGNFHKIFGFYILGHVGYRMWATTQVIYDAGFTSSWWSLASVWVVMVLQSSSFIFDVPRARLLGSPMIWQEWRAHNFVFVLRHVLSFTICWIYTRWYPEDDAKQQKNFEFFLDFGAIAVLYWQLYTVDIITAWVREDKHTSLTASWPFWDGCPLWLERAIKFYYTIAQFQASTIMIFTGPSMGPKFLVIFPFQFASFLMTLVRKGIITTKGFHAGYLWSLFTVLWLIIGPGVASLVTGTVLWSLMYTVRFYGLSKYALWFGPVVASVLFYMDAMESTLMNKGLCMVATWIVCMLMQKLVMGFTLEVRARRFLESRHKPLVLGSREVVNDSLVLLRFKLPAGYSAGMNPGQHVKIHVPNPSHGCQKWNNARNLEEPADELSRSYTPVSCTTSPTLDFLVRRYPKDPDRGFPDGGRASTYLTEQVELNSDVMVSGPHGHQIYFGQGIFLVGKEKVQARVCGALAAGSGITPVLAVLRDIWQEGRRDVADRDQRLLNEKTVLMKEFSLVHVTRTAGEALPPEWYAPPAGTKGEQTPIRYSHILTGGAAKAEVPGAAKCWAGKLTEEIAKQALPAPGDDVVILVCGPQGFNESLCRPILQALGYKNVIMLQ